MRASVAAVEPTFTAADVMRRHDSRVKRQTAMCLAVATAMAVFAIFLPKHLGQVDAASMTVKPLAGHTTSYVDSVYGWSITYNRALVAARTLTGRKPNVLETVRFTNFRPRAHDTAFPLQVAKFTPMRRYAGGSEPTPVVQVFSGDGLLFKAAVWIGRL